MHTIVILHGWGQSKETWKGVFENVSDFETVVFDLPGFGQEKVISLDWGVPEYAMWVAKKIEDRGLQNVILLGHSLGGRIAVQVASEHPQWLSGLIIYGAPCLYRPAMTIRTKKQIAKLARMFGFVGKYRGNPELNAADKNGLGAIFRRIVGFDQTESLKKITVPTLLLWGEKDADVPLIIAREMQQLIAGSRLEVLPGLGHNAHLENPNLFFGVVKKYVQTF